VKAEIAAVPDAQEATESFPQLKRLALIISKGTLDQAYPPLVMATTAASMGWEVAIFFYLLRPRHRAQRAHAEADG
jgi:hypothetical protein